VFLLLLIVAAVYSTSSASSIDRYAHGKRNAYVAANAQVAVNTGDPASDRKGETTHENYFLAAMRRAFPLILPSSFLKSPAPPFQTQTFLPTPGLVFYKADCATPEDVFNLGDTVCVKVMNVDPNLNAHVDWVGASDLVQASSNGITTGSLTTSFTIPLDGNVGRWRANITSASDGAARASGFFTVRDPDNANADLSVNKLVKLATATAGSDIEFEIDVVNNGPNDATNVVLTDTLANDTTFVSLARPSGWSCTTPTVGATGLSTCSIGSLASGETAIFTATYKVDAGAAANTLLTSTAHINATSPADRFAPNDTSTDSAPVHVEPCVVTCPANITNVPNAQDEFGAFVTLPTATGSSAACGDLNYSPASGSLFPVGTTVVTVSGDTGNACSFTVEVKDTQSPTIDCPDDYSTFESSAGSGSAIANYAPPLATDNDPSFNASSVSCSPASGSSFNVGTTPVTCTATDAAGNTSSCSFNVTVQSLATCALSCPSNIVQDSDANSCGANVNYAATASTDCGTVTYTNAKTGAALPSGSFFPVGTTTVKATSSTGQTCLFRVTIRDTTPPSFTCPSPIAVNAGVGACDARLTITTPSVTDNCTGATITGVRDDNRPLTDPYQVGTTTITWTAKDKAGLTTSCEQTVTVRDNTPPIVTLVPDINLSVPADACQVEVPEVIDLQVNTEGRYGTASDNCATSKRLTIVQRPAAGTLVLPGTYTITVTVYDGDPDDTINPPNKTTKTTTLHVTDSSAAIFAPPNVTVGTGAGSTSCATVVSDAALGAATLKGNCGLQVIRTGVPVGNLFPVGTTTVTYTVTDAVGTQQSATQSVTVVDDTPPTITAPPGVTVGTGPGATSCTAIVSDAALGTATAQDNCSVTVTRAGVPAGNVFPKGTTVITWTATDGSGNHTTATQSVTVVDDTPPTITLNGQTVTLWPPNHKYHTVSVTDLVASAGDNCDSSVNLSKVVIAQVTSDELEDDPNGGDGDTLNDIVIAPDCKSVQLRAERDGNRNGRVYTITFRVRDASGNTQTITALVSVPKSQGNGGAAVKDATAYTVTGSCP
jgi:uncharacterized repeat protein (TIGR01451 family)